MKNEIIKADSIFYCEKCNFTTKRKSHWDRHIYTMKHKKNYNKDNYCVYVVCSNCDKKYKDRSGLWRHEKYCKKRILDKITKPIVSEPLLKDNDLITALVKQNVELMDLLKDQNTIIKEVIPKIGNTIISNSKFNLNLFLNEDCKNAINLSDFVNSLQLSSDEIAETTKKGYVKGISNIFINGLKQLEITQRPIHCSDIKKETLYIRDNDKWSKDNSEQKINHAIQVIDQKQIHMIKEWERLNPNWNETDKGRKAYMEIVRSVTSGINISEKETCNKIIKNVIKEVIL